MSAPAVAHAAASGVPIDTINRTDPVVLSVVDASVLNAASVGSVGLNVGSVSDVTAVVAPAVGSVSVTCPTSVGSADDVPTATPELLGAVVSDEPCVGAIAAPWVGTVPDGNAVTVVNDLVVVVVAFTALVVVVVVAEVVAAPRTATVTATLHTPAAVSDVSALR